MKLLLLAAGLLVTVLSVQGGINPKDSPAWMLWPGKDGKPQLVILRGPKPDEEKFDPSEITFHHYSRGNMATAVQMFVGNMNEANFAFDKPTKFIVHGFTESGLDAWVMDMKLKFLTSEDCNVVAVDWERPAQGPFYNNAKQRTKPSGEVMGQFMDYLVTQGSNLGTMHCVGFSLGAHACGFAGKVQTAGKLGRVTGLDPALPLYDYQNPLERLHESDATFVDIIHTCGNWLAFWHPLGHADFYPNNGEGSQPGCGFDLTGACSHSRSYELFTESIWSAQFRALRCDSWADFRNGVCDGNQAVVMGNQVPTSASGAYYLRTMGQPPYAMG